MGHIDYLMVNFCSKLMALAAFSVQYCLINAAGPQHKPQTMRRNLISGPVPEVRQSRTAGVPGAVIQLHPSFGL
jgi:hypothetical protein